MQSGSSWLFCLRRSRLLPRRRVREAFRFQGRGNDPKVFFPQRLTLLAIFVATFLFSLAWQFNQFMMLVQALVLFSLDSLDMLPAAKVSAAPARATPLSCVRSWDALSTRAGLPRV